MVAMRSSRLTYSTLALGAVLALGACSASDTDPEPTATDTAATVTAEPTADAAEPDVSDEPTDAEPDAEPETETETDTTEPSDGALAGGGDTACLNGSWLYSGEEFERTFVEMMGQAGGPEFGDISVTGNSVMTFDGSTLTQEYGPQEVTIDVDAGSMEMSMIMTMSGSTTGDYTVDGDIITVSSVDMEDYGITTKVLVDGAEMPGLEDLGLDDMLNDVGGTAEGTVRFGCVGDELTLVALVPEMPDFQFGYTLTRQ